MRFLSIIFIVFCCVFAGAPTHAQRIDSPRYDSAEDIALVYYKSGDLVPPFQEWIENSEMYSHTAWARREKVMAQELERLRGRYVAFDPDDDYIQVRTGVRPVLTADEPTKDGEPTGGQLDMTFTIAPDAIYFPFNYADNRYAVMPYALEKMMSSRMGAARFAYLRNALEQSSGHVLLIRMAPREAVMDRPYDLDGTPHWVLKTDILAAELRTRKGGLLWEYTADGYIAPELEAINGLHELRPEKSNAIGSVKPFKTGP